ncbi:MAG: hypothetical protein GXY42_06105 [Desulfovibrionales bacterium]|nr:hypothetical protein [Desulfovibrionales bacterium]
MNTDTRRFLVFRSAKSGDFLCVCAARSRSHALKIARRMFRLEQTAWAIEERQA